MVKAWRATVAFLSFWQSFIPIKSSFPSLVLFVCRSLFILFWFYFALQYISANHWRACRHHHVGGSDRSSLLWIIHRVFSLVPYFEPRDDYINRLVFCFVWFFKNIIKITSVLVYSSVELMNECFGDHAVTSEQLSNAPPKKCTDYSRVPAQ